MATPAFLNVVDFGADPTGHQDSTAAFNATMAALPAGGGGIEVPPGTFLLNDWTPNKSNVVLRGSGMFVSTLKGSTPGNFVVRMSDIGRWTVSELTFEANEVKQSAVTIAGSNPHNSSTGNMLFTHCYFRGATQDTLRLGNVGGSDDVSFNTFFDCIFD